jgi:hypothetical protein
VVDKVYREGEAELLSLDLISFDGSRTMSIVSQFQIMRIFESILSPVIQLEVALFDAINLFETFPITGEEYIEVEFRTPGTDTTNKTRVKVTHVSDRMVMPNNRGIIYSLSGVSDEIVKNNSTRVSKGYKDTGDAIIEDLLMNVLGTKKKFYKEGTTKGTMEVVVPNMYPLQAIDYIRLGLVSTKYESSSFVFFENQNGFALCTLEHAFEIGHDGIGDRMFFFDTDANADISRNNFRNVLAYKHLTSASQLSSIARGHVVSETTRIDLRTGDVEKKRFDLSDKEGDFKFPDKNPTGMMTSSFQSAVSDKPAERMLIPFNSKHPENFVLDSIGAKRSFINLLTQNVTQVLVYGDSGLTIGQVVNLKLPKVNGLTADNGSLKDSELVSGNYGIAKLCHILSNEGGSIAHTTVMECLKGSYGESDK